MQQVKNSDFKESLTNLVWFVFFAKTYTITESKAQLSSLVQQVMETGEMVVIGKHGQPMVKLVPYEAEFNPSKRLGAFEGEIILSDDFDTWGSEEARALGIID